MGRPKQEPHCKKCHRVKKITIEFAHTVQQNAKYWSAQEEASFRAADAALGKLVRASQQVGRKHKDKEKTKGERITQRSQEAEKRGNVDANMKGWGAGSKGANG